LILLIRHAQVRFRHALHRFLSPARVLGTMFPKPFDTPIGTSHPIRPRVLPDHGVLTAIENP